MALFDRKVKLHDVPEGGDVKNYWRAADANALLDHVAGWVNVKSHGATGDGVTDDTAAIQAALATAYSERKGVYVPPGTYRITAPITLTGSGGGGNQWGFSIVSDAPVPRHYSGVPVPTSRYAVFDASGAANWTTGRAILEFVDVHGVTLRNLWFLGNGTAGRGSTNATTTGVQFSDEVTWGHHIEGCAFQLHRIGLDMEIAATGYASFVNNVVTNCWYRGIRQLGGDVQWIGNYVNESNPANTDPLDIGTGVGMLLDQCRSVTIIGGKFEWCAHGIVLYHVADVSIGHGLLWDKCVQSISVYSDATINPWAGKAIQIVGNHFLASGGSFSEAQHIYFQTLNSAKVSVLIAGNFFAKGSQDAYAENDGTVSCLSSPNPTPTTSTEAGTLPAGTYYYRVCARVDGWADNVASAEVSHVLAASGGVGLSWDAVTGTQPAWAQAPGVVSRYRIFGRSPSNGADAMRLIGEVTAPTTTFTDDGSVTPSGDVPPTITPRDLIGFSGTTGHSQSTITGNCWEGGSTRGYVYCNGAAGSRLKVSGNSGAPFSLVVESTVAVVGDVPYLTAAPTGGTWQTGDIVWNAAPAGGAAPGWVCTAGGTPGTWKAMANLAA